MIGITCINRDKPSEICPCGNPREIGTMHWKIPRCSSCLSNIIRKKIDIYEIMGKCWCVKCHTPPSDCLCETVKNWHYMENEVRLF